MKSQHKVCLNCNHKLFPEKILVGLQQRPNKILNFNLFNIFPVFEATDFIASNWIHSYDNWAFQNGLI